MSSVPGVLYFYHPNLSVQLPAHHRFKPFRGVLTHSLLSALGVFRLDVLRPFAPPLVTRSDLGQFHTDNLLSLLQVAEDVLEKSAQPNMDEHLGRVNLSTDLCSPSPVFPGVYSFCRMYTTGSVGGAAALNARLALTVINWFGGASRARKAWVFDGCYANDAVLAVLELLKAHERVLYISMEFAHCSGVEEAFYSTDRVLTLSFHRAARSGPGQEEDAGYGRGKGYAVNVPIEGGVVDEEYCGLFERVCRAAADAYRPSAVVFVASPSVLAADRDGDFDLSSQGHARCVSAVAGLQLPMLVLGGLGSNSVNAARVWARATAILAGCESRLDLAGVPADHDCAPWSPELTALDVPAVSAPSQLTTGLLAALEQRVLRRIQVLGGSEDAPAHMVGEAHAQNGTAAAATAAATATGEQQAHVSVTG
jgi:histone deacetylase 1/2